MAVKKPLHDSIAFPVFLLCYILFFIGALSLKADAFAWLFLVDIVVIFVDMILYRYLKSMNAFIASYKFLGKSTKTIHAVLRRSGKLLVLFVCFVAVVGVVSIVPNYAPPDFSVLFRPAPPRYNIDDIELDPMLPPPPEVRDAAVVVLFALLSYFALKLYLKNKIDPTEIRENVEELMVLSEGRKRRRHIAGDNATRKRFRKKVNAHIRGGLIVEAADTATAIAEKIREKEDILALSDDYNRARYADESHRDETS